MKEKVEINGAYHILYNNLQKMFRDSTNAYLLATINNHSMKRLNNSNYFYLSSSLSTISEREREKKRSPE